jgi:hypothetical protein
MGQHGKFIHACPSRRAISETFRFPTGNFPDFVVVLTISMSELKSPRRLTKVCLNGTKSKLRIFAQMHFLFRTV